MDFARQIQLDGGTERGRLIGQGQPGWIVAEAGVSHYGKIERAIRLVDLAVEAGADAVKFQVYDTDNFIDPDRDPEQYKRYMENELSFSAFGVIQQYCHHRGIIFFATAHEEFALGYLETIDVPVIKVGSGEVGNWTFIEKVAKTGKPVFLSTGMYSDSDVATVVDIFTGANNPNLVLMHCVTEYPTPFKNANLNRINELKKYGTLVGYSDHTDRVGVACTAIHLGICVVEKHFILGDNKDDGKRDSFVASSYDGFFQIMKERNFYQNIMYPKHPTAWARKNLETGLRPE